ncbi:MAG TPA: hypothetical protein VKE95_21955 [Burkholderiales bacterium]|nr:hypothetical protein [Burkholderiales bacterium]
MKALLLLLAALLVGFSPGAAFAHNGEHHGASNRLEGGNASTAERHNWSPVCPPGSDHVCACGNLSLLDGSAKPPTLPRRAASTHHPVSIAAPASQPVAASQPSPQFRPSLPRAPPA